MAATTWHRLGTRDELVARAPFSVRVERHTLAVFLHEGRLRAIGNACNHKGGPLCEGRLRDEYVVCPWHGWEYSVVTGHGPEGYDEEQVPVFERRGARRRRLRRDAARLAAQAHQAQADRTCSRSTRSRPVRRRACSASRRRRWTTGNPRFSTSDALLEHALDHARERVGADTQARSACASSRFRHCEGNYSKAARACTWPCAITERDPGDELTPVYEGLVHWADVVLVATPIRWGNAVVALLQDGRAAELHPEPDHARTTAC